MTCHDQIRSFFSDGGTLSRCLPHYEFRAEQLEMSLAVAQAAEKRETLLLEAGTGVGKSLGYLVPLILKALKEDKRIFIATGTKTLQHQLMEKELPFLKKYLGVDFSYALCLGAENYLCERRLAAIGLSGQEDLFADAREVSAVRAWTETCRFGLRSEIDFPLSNQTWFQVCRVPELCAGQDCGKGGECFYQRSRKWMSHADVLVGNHHLLFANLQAEWEYLPGCQILVVDEAHSLDTAASSCLGIEFSIRALRRVWEGLRGKDGKGCLVGSILEIPIEQRLGLLDRIREAEKRFTETIHWFHEQILAGQPRVSVSHETARQGLEHFMEPLSETVAALRQMGRRVEREEARIECEGYAARLARTLEEARQVTEMPTGAPWLLWCEEVVHRGKSVTEAFSTAAFHATPLSPGDLLREKLYPHFESSILVSATLAADGDFTFFKERLGTPGAHTLSLPSPFDYKSNLLVYAPEHIPEPSRFEEYIAEITNQVVALAGHAHGGTFVLCTSFKVLDLLYERFREKVSSVGYASLARKRSGARSSRLLVLRQGEASREKILEAFKAADRAVLFGAATFWQGVDVPGKALELVAITRLPFQVPDDPVLEARIRLCREGGGNPFNEIQVPHAVMQFRQGMGRLIRNKTDRGVVAILDSRVITKSYGEAFLTALPDCGVTRDLGEVQRFLA